MVVNFAGQFYHGIGFEVGDLRPGEVPEKPDATMYVKGHQLNVTRYTSSPATLHVFHQTVKLLNHLVTSVSLGLQRLATGLQEGFEERRKCPVLVHPQ